MKTQGFCHLSFMLSWILTFLITFVCSGIGAQTMKLEQRVFVALADEDLHVDIVLVKPANHSGGTLECFASNNSTPIHSSYVSPTDRVEVVKVNVTLKNLKPYNSGDYRCEYKRARVNWVLLVRDMGYWEPFRLSDYTGVIIVSVIGFVLLIFNVVGSVYVAKGHRDIAPLNTEHGSTDGRREQNREESREEEEDVTPAASTSFYASLDARPRSIYDVLDQSAVDREADQRKAKHKSKEAKKRAKKRAQKRMEQTPPNQDEGVFDSVYENL